MKIEIIETRNYLKKIGYKIVNKYYYKKIYNIDNKNYKVLLRFKMCFPENWMKLIDTIYEKEIYTEYYIETRNIPIVLRKKILEITMEFEKKYKIGEK